MAKWILAGGGQVSNTVHVGLVCKVSELDVGFGAVVGLEGLPVGTCKGRELASAVGAQGSIVKEYRGIVVACNFEQVVTHWLMMARVGEKVKIRIWLDEAHFA